MPLKARRHIRKMRGGAQSHLLEAADGNFYVVKFLNNPQHRRILVNEWIAGVFLKYLQISSPDVVIIEIDDEFLTANPDVYIALGSKSLPVEAGWHFGSRFPGDPSTTAVYDFIPDSLLHQVSNVNDFLGALVFDKWTSNADGRQSVFFRARLREWAHDVSVHPNKLGFVVVMIDQGFIFDGPNWSFPESPVQGLYSRKLVYESVRSIQDFEPWLEQVVNFPEEVVDRAYRGIPLTWIEGEGNALEAALEKLMRRRKRVPDLLSDCRRAKLNPFPNWR